MSCVEDDLMFWHTLSWKMANVVRTTTEQPAPPRDIAILQKQKLHISQLFLISILGKGKVPLSLPSRSE